MGHRALPPEVIAHVVNRGSSGGGRQLVSEAARQARDTIEAQFQRHAQMLQDYSPAAGNGDDVPCVLLQCAQTLDTERLCGVAYPWLSDAAAREQGVADWRRFVGRNVPILSLDCDHFQVFEEKHVSLSWL